MQHACLAGRNVCWWQKIRPARWHCQSDMEAACQLCRWPRVFLQALALGAMLTLGTATAMADQIVSVKGQPVVLRGAQPLSAVAGMVIEDGDELVSLPSEELLVSFEDGARLAIRPSSRVWIRALSGRRGASKVRTLRVSLGRARFVSARNRAQDATGFETPSATIGIRGTDIEIVVEENLGQSGIDGTYLIVNEGVAQLRGADGSQVEVQPGQVAFGARVDLTPRTGRTRTLPAARLLAPAEFPSVAPGAMDEQLR